MSFRPSKPEIEERYSPADWSDDPLPQYVITVDGHDTRYYNTRAEAEAFVEGFNYIWERG